MGPVRGCRRTPTRGNSKGWGSFRRGSRRLRRWCNSRSRRLALPYGRVIGDIVDVLTAWEAAVPILIKPFLHCLRADSSTLLPVRSGWLVADHVCSSHCVAAPLPAKGPATLRIYLGVEQAPPHLCGFARCAQSPPRQRPAEGHGGARPRPRGRSGHRRQRREPGGGFASKAKEQPHALTHALGATM